MSLIVPSKRLKRLNTVRLMGRERLKQRKRFVTIDDNHKCGVREGAHIKQLIIWEERMFSRIRKRLSYTNIVMTLALFFAISGGAYAASKVLITSTKQISPKVLK